MTTATAWEFPLEQIEQRHHDRIDPEYPVQPFIVEAWHEGCDEATLYVVVGHVDGIEERDAMLHAIDAIMSITLPTYLVFTFDSHMASSPTNPKTDKPWGPHEMQNLCDEDGACEVGLIRDNLVVTTVRMSDGKIRMKAFPYHPEPEKITYFDDDIRVMSEWDEDSDGEVMAGLITDVVRGCYERATDERMTATRKMVHDGCISGGVRPEMLRFYSILSASRVLAGLSQQVGGPLFNCLIAAMSDEEKQLMTDLGAQPLADEFAEAEAAEATP